MTVEGVIVTTGVRSGIAERAVAEQVAAELGCAFVPRVGRSLKAVAGGAAHSVLVAEARGLNLVHIDGPDPSPFFFHPGMGLNRMRQMALGGHDHMVDAMQLSSGMRVLDCTLGMAADALVASYAVGAEGRVVGLEASPLVAAIVGHGLAGYSLHEPDMNAAMRRIEAVNCDYRDYLSSAAMGGGNFDVVYFDPMFVHPVTASSGIAGLRMWACHAPLGAEAFGMAERAAGQRVVLKMRRFAQLPPWRPPDRIEGGATSTVKYLVWETGASDAH